MATTLERIKADLETLSVQDRAELVQLLIESFDHAHEAGDQNWESEVDQRVRDVESGKVSGKSSEQVFRETKAVRLRSFR